MILRSIASAFRRQDWATVAVEFVVVVVGIFVGMQADDWNQLRKDHALEREYLHRLLADTRWNIENFRELEAVFESKADFIGRLRKTAATELLLSKPEEFIRGLEASGYVALPAVKSATFAELQNSGRISLLRDIELRSQLATFYADYRLMQSILDEPVGEYRRLLWESIPGELNYDWWISDRFDSAPIREALLDLQADARFEAAANAEITYAADLIYWLRLHRRQAEEILAAIDRSLGEQ